MNKPQYSHLNKSLILFNFLLNLKHASGSLLAASVLSRSILRPGKNDCIIYLRIHRSKPKNFHSLFLLKINTNLGRMKIYDNLAKSHQNEKCPPE